MSGLEVIGAVLAFWPVVGTLVTTGHALKHRRTIRMELQRELGFRETLFIECTRALLVGDETLSDEERKAFWEPTGAHLWKSEALAARARSRLSSRTFNQVISEIEVVLELLTEVQKTLLNGDVGQEVSLSVLLRHQG